jgi:nanoRNase/pAp phosphatase (c-di-AMP/oligoRNAs hydrolase)
MKIAAGLDRFAQAAKLHDGHIIVFDVTTRKNDMISRYAPYYFFPEARYSVGIVRSPKSARITAMRNPWREFPSVHLGKIFEDFGGGGHQRVGAVILAGIRAQEAGSILAEITRRIREQDRLTEGAHARDSASGNV